MTDTDCTNDDERTFTQIGTVTIDGDVYGVVGLDADEGGAAVCEHGAPGEILFFACSDWPDARRAMEAAGYWTAA